MRSLGMPSDGKNGERDGGLCDLRVHNRYRPGPGARAPGRAGGKCVFAIGSVFGNCASRKGQPPRTRHTPRKFLPDRFRRGAPPARPPCPLCALAPACAASSLLNGSTGHATVPAHDWTCPRVRIVHHRTSNTLASCGRPRRLESHESGEELWRRPLAIRVLLPLVEEARDTPVVNLRDRAAVPLRLKHACNRLEYGCPISHRCAVGQHERHIVRAVEARVARITHADLISRPYIPGPVLVLAPRLRRGLAQSTQDDVQSLLLRTNESASRPRGSHRTMCTRRVGCEACNALLEL